MGLKAQGVPIRTHKPVPTLLVVQKAVEWPSCCCRDPQVPSLSTAEHTSHSHLSAPACAQGLAGPGTAHLPTNIPRPSLLSGRTQRLTLDPVSRCGRGQSPTVLSCLIACFIWLPQSLCSVSQNCPLNKLLALESFS